jgi:hypothetical protein
MNNLRKCNKKKHNKKSGIKNNNNHKSTIEKKGFLSLFNFFSISKKNKYNVLYFPLFISL